MRKVLVVAALAAVALVGCGDDEPSNVTPDAPVTEGWQTYTDPTTDVTFRCIERWIKRGYAGGLAIWCYEPDGTEPDPGG